MDGPAVRCLRIVASRLAGLSGTPRLRLSKAHARRVRTLELVVAACVAEAAAARRAEPEPAPVPVEQRPPTGERTDPTVRGAWDRPR